MKKILLFLLDGYADWESGFVSAKLNKQALGYLVQTVSLDSGTVTSQGNFTTSIDYSIDQFQDFSDLAALVLIGGTGWGDQHLIRGYNVDQYDEKTSKRITGFIDRCLSSSNTFAASICDGATFMADNEYLDTVVHTGNSIAHLKDKAPAYKGENLFQKRQAVSAEQLITANGTAPLEFTREILLSLNILGSEENANEWYKTYKNGIFTYNF